MIELNNCIKQIKLDFKPKFVFKKIVRITNKLLSINDRHMIVVNLIDSNEIQTINKKYRLKDNVTDVISFSFYESIKNSQIIGEIYISVEQAIKQAHEYNHSIKREICFLFTHGLLHLYGFDHQNETDANIMFDWQKQILNKCKIGRDT